MVAITTLTMRVHCYYPGFLNVDVNVLLFIVQKAHFKKIIEYANFKWAIP